MGRAPKRSTPGARKIGRTEGVDGFVHCIVSFLFSPFQEKTTQLPPIKAMQRGNETRWDSQYEEAKYHLEYFRMIPTFYQNVCSFHHNLFTFLSF